MPVTADWKSYSGIKDAAFALVKVKQMQLTMFFHEKLRSRHMVVCRAAQEAGAPHP